MSESGNRVHQSVRVRVSYVVKKNGSGARVRWARWAAAGLVGPDGGLLYFFLSETFSFSNSIFLF